MNKTTQYQVYTALREEAGLTDYKVAKASGVSPAVLSQWKRGDYNLKLEKLQKLAKVFQVPVETFWSGSALNFIGERSDA